MVAVAKVAQIFRRFDNDRDRYLSYEEVKALEWEVSRQELSTANYVALCEAVVADPDRGLDEQVRRSETRIATPNIKASCTIHSCLPP